MKPLNVTKFDILDYNDPDMNYVDSTWMSSGWDAVHPFDY